MTTKNVSNFDYIKTLGKHFAWVFIECFCYGFTVALGAIIAVKLFF